MLIKSLAVRQPYANLIAARLKTVEVRTWCTHYRGRLLIVAPKQTSKYLASHADLVPLTPRGCAICVVDLIGCVPLEARHRVAAYYPQGGLTGRYAWLLGWAHEIDHFAVKARQGLFYTEVPL